MDTSAIRLRFDVKAETVGYLCTTCGQAYPRAFTDDDNLEWLPLDVLLATVEHECATPAWRDVPAPSTPRETDAAMLRFLAEALVRDPVGVVPFRDLLEAYEARSGIYPDSGLFSRRLRAVLPPGTAIRREMINGVRARRLVGMRLRRQDE